MRRDSRQGFTLVELAIVVGIISIVAGVATTSMSRYLAHERVVRAGHAVVWTLATARSMAVRAGHPMVFSLSETNREILVRDSTGTVFRKTSLGVGSELRITTLEFDMPGDSLIFSERGFCVNCPASPQSIIKLTTGRDVRVVRVSPLGRGELSGN